MGNEAADVEFAVVNDDNKSISPIAPRLGDLCFELITRNRRFPLFDQLTKRAERRRTNLEIKSISIQIFGSLMAIKTYRLFRLTILFPAHVDDALTFTM